LPTQRRCGAGERISDSILNIIEATTGLSAGHSDARRRS